ncbi:hypothetical protein [Actinoplanes sp. HUAS TT8]|uniref:hypothetical protein n=1 Tax=Actinoplanes sp. HUAS TT8 TaxID=3447453 RepID=UPI003F52162F
MGVPRWIRVGAGPALVSALILGGLLGARYLPEKKPSGPEAIGECRIKPDSVRDIRAEKVLLEAPRPDRFGDVDDSALQCAGEVAMAAVSRPLTGSVAEQDVREFYAKLAEGSGWHARDDKNGIYAATKDVDGGCPWLFTVIPAQYGYQLQVVYLPSGVDDGKCSWD